MKKFKLTIIIEVDQIWIDDGFNPDTKEWRESIEEAILVLLPYARQNEFKVVIKKVE